MRARWEVGMNSTSRSSRAASPFSMGAGSPWVAVCFSTLTMKAPCVCRLSILALIKPLLSSFIASAPPIRIARPNRLSSTISRPRREPGGILHQGLALRTGSGLAVAITNAVEGFDGVEFRINLAELAAHTLDVAVDGAVVDIDLVVVGGVHQIIAALHEAGPLGQGLQQQKFRHRQLHRPVVPQAVVAGGGERQPAALDGPGGGRARGGLGGGHFLAGVGPTQHRLDPLNQQPLAEGFVDVVVGAEIEAEDLVDLVILG